MTQPLATVVQEVAALLKNTNTRVVFAESCTAGLISATLGRVPGISEFHCGSAVVYRLDSKTKWLDVSPEILVNSGPVSSEVAEAMARGVLVKTPEAQISVAITGHLGPNAPADQDGLVYVGIATREAVPGYYPPAWIEQIDAQTVRRELPKSITCLTDTGAESLREWRQWKATELVLTLLRDHLAARNQ